MPHRRPHTGWLKPLSRMVSLAALAAVCQGAHAQAAPAASAPGGGADDAAHARAQREADKVFQWIRIHSDKPRKAAVAAPEKPAAAPVRTVAKPARPADPVVTETVQPIAPARTDVAAHAVPAPAVAAARIEPPAPPPATAPVIEEEVTLTPVLKTEPEFPASLMRTLRKGMVQVAFTVQPDGSVAQAHVVSASNARLGPAAVATVSQWRFQPVRHAQEAVVDLGFNLD